MMEAHQELVQSAISAARSARGLLAGEMERLPPSLQERTSGIIQKLFAVEVGKLEAVTRGVEQAVTGLLELASEEGASSAYAQALTLLFPLSQELQRAMDPEMALSGPQPILLQPRQSMEQDMSMSGPQPILLQPAQRKDELERRRGARIGLEVDIGLHSDTNFFAGFSGDVSKGGMFVATYSPLAVGTRIELSFVLPGGYQVITQGQVTWVRDTVDRQTATPGMGVRFTGLSDKDRAMIERFSENREPIFYDT